MKAMINANEEAAPVPDGGISAKPKQEACRVPARVKETNQVFEE